MKLSAYATLAVLCLFAPAYAQSSLAWDPCLSGEATMEGTIAAFQAEGWNFPTSNEDHIDNLRTTAEPLFAMQNLAKVDSGVGYDRFIAAAHERAEGFQMDSATLKRDGLVVAIEHYEAGNLIRCTVAGRQFDDITTAFETRSDEVVALHGNEFLVDKLDDPGKRADVTLFRVERPADATAQGLAPLAAVAVRHMQD